MNAPTLDTLLQYGVASDVAKKAESVGVASLTTI